MPTALPDAPPATPGFCKCDVRTFRYCDTCGTPICRACRTVEPALRASKIFYYECVPCNDARRAWEHELLAEKLMKEMH